MEAMVAFRRGQRLGWCIRARAILFDDLTAGGARLRTVDAATVGFGILGAWQLNILHPVVAQR